MLKNQKGITLIALVITIIVLLILAGVSIAMLTGPNGLITRANDAKTATKLQDYVENVNTALQAAYTEIAAYNKLPEKDKFESENPNVTITLAANATTEGVVVTVTSKNDSSVTGTINYESGTYKINNAKK